MFLSSVLVISSQYSSALGYREFTQEGAMTISPFAAREGTGAPQWPIVKNVVVTSFRPVTSSSSHTRCRLKAKLENSPARYRPSIFNRLLVCDTKIRGSRKWGTASLRSRTCVKRNAVFGARFKGLSLYFLCQKGNLIRIKTGVDTYLIRIQARTRLSRYPPCDCSKKSHWTDNYYIASRYFQN